MNTNSESNALFHPALHVGQPQIPEQEALFEKVEQVLRSGRLSNDGPQLHAYEIDLAKTLQTPHVIAMTNGTLALMVLLKALQLQGEVIVPSFTFPATVHVLNWLGLRPVFCEIDPQTHCLDPRAVETLIRPQTCAILGVHLWGGACEIHELEQLAQAYQLKLLFDSAHAFGSYYKQHPIGRFGSAEMFSLHATKFMHSIEGGIISTTSSELADELRRLRNFGYQDSVIESIGINAKMNEISACVGRHLLSFLPTLLASNRQRFEWYQQGLSDISGVHLFQRDSQDVTNHQYIVLLIQPDAKVNRDQLWQILQTKGVLARRYFDPPVHLSKPYQNQASLPLTETLASQTLVLPTGLSVQQREIEQICKLIREIAT